MSRTHSSQARRTSLRKTEARAHGFRQPGHDAAPVGRPPDAMARAPFGGETQVRRARPAGDLGDQRNMPTSGKSLPTGGAGHARPPAAPGLGERGDPAGAAVAFGSPEDWALVGAIVLVILALLALVAIGLVLHPS
jgi:hypothetical protein